VIKKWTLSAIRFYQKWVSPLLPPSCRHEPTCSEYMSRSIRKYGLLKGGGRGIFRIVRCNPLSKGGFDPA
jgi:hypothetical protein